MTTLTALVLGALGLYVAAMVAGHLPTDFSLFLFVCTLVSGVYFVADYLVYLPRRRAAAAQELAAFDARNEPARRHDAAAVDRERAAMKDRLLMRPWWLEYTAGFFPVIVLVFGLRSFLFEPFRIPSGSMIPTLQVGDLILVNKYQYGIRLPIVNQTIIPVGQPQRGDVIVFRYPHDTTQDYIKRIVGLPGDVVEYRNHELRVNGTPVRTDPVNRYYEPGRGLTYQQLSEHLGAVDHRILQADGDGAQAFPAVLWDGPGSCDYQEGAIRCTVPAAHYFVMGDNRDNSEDSRFWGFVPDRNIVGHAFFIWMNFGDIHRVGSFR
jgi:signal peptidase I